MTRNIFIDFDGTLIDCRKRLYNLFQELVPQSNFSFEEYWAIKRKRTNQDKLLRGWFDYSEREISEFKKVWLAKVEEEERLALDVPFDCASELLQLLSQRYDLYIVTNRQNLQRAVGQVNSFGWERYYKKVLITEQKATKAEIVRENVRTSPDDIFIGDTGEDILAGKELSLRTIAVSSGFLDAVILKEYDPDLIAESMKELYENNTLESL
jgi:phosphoglycolate phosphatase